MTMALEGITVLDLCGFPGVWTAMAMADFGADVIRIREVAVEGRRSEQAARVGTQRRSPGVRQDYMNRNKKSICLNLKHPEAREAFYRLVDGADVLLEGFRPGVAKRLKIDYETLSGRNPRLIYCAITGYGQDGPYAHLVGHDINYISIAGAQGLMGPRNGLPALPSQQLADLGGGGQGALIGILLALQARHRTGKGQMVDISMTDGVVSWLVTHAAPYFADGTLEPRGDTLQTGRWPNYYVYETKDHRLITIAALEPWFWENLCTLLGREDLIPYEFDEPRREEIRAVFAEIFKTRTRDEWWEYLNTRDVCVGKVYDLNEVFEDPQVKHRGMVVDLKEPGKGEMRMLGIPWKLSATPGGVRHLPPAEGEDTDEILRGLNYTDVDLGRLRQEGAIK